MPESTLILENTENGLCTLTLNRPEKHNAFNPEIISALTEKLNAIKTNDQIRAVILRAEGPHFCAGADLGWMKQTTDYSQEDNEKDAALLATLLHTLSTLPKPTIGLAQGRVMGGGVGLLACCDIIVASDDATFCFSEVKLGLIPATIAPYVIQRIGHHAARRYFITAQVIHAAEAKKINLVDQITTPDALAKSGQDLAESLKANGPRAMAAAKQLVNTLAWKDPDIIQQTSRILAEIRSSAEAQEGIQAFFEKRSPQWVTNSDMT